MACLPSIVLCDDEAGMLVEINAVAIKIIKPERNKHAEFILEKVRV